MRGESLLSLVVLFGVLGTPPGLSTARAQSADCLFFKVTVRVLNVFTQPHGDSTFIGALNNNDVVCVTGDQQVGDRAWAHIAYQVLTHDQRKTLNGWAIKDPLQPATPAELAALHDAPAAAPPPAPAPAPAPVAQPTPPGNPATPAKPATPVKTAKPTSPPAPGAPSDQDIIRFSEPIKFGPFPVNGLSLEQLVTKIPDFPPIEGLPDEVWKKTCNNCHKWNRQTLCVQANIYVKDPKMMLRIKHPFGGPEKVVMKKWAEGGCQ